MQEPPETASTDADSAAAAPTEGRARVEYVPRDVGAARKLLDQAARQLSDAGTSELAPHSGYELAYNATLKALIGSLLWKGKRVRPGTGWDLELIREASYGLRLPRELCNRLDEMRRTRHAAFYEADDVTDGMLESAVSDTHSVVSAAERLTTTVVE